MAIRYFKIVHRPGSMHGDTMYRPDEMDPDGSGVIDKMFLTRGLIQELTIHYCDGRTRVLNLKQIREYEYVEMGR